MKRLPTTVFKVMTANMQSVNQTIFVLDETDRPVVQYELGKKAVPPAGKLYGFSTQDAARRFPSRSRFDMLLVEGEGLIFDRFPPILPIVHSDMRNVRSIAHWWHRITTSYGTWRKVNPTGCSESWRFKQGTAVAPDGIMLDWFVPQRVVAKYSGVLHLWNDSNVEPEFWPEG